MKDGEQVGVVTIGMYSSLNTHNVGIARMPVDCAVDGTAMSVKNADAEIPCVAHSMPFYDPDKKAPHRQGLRPEPGMRLRMPAQLKESPSG